MNIVKWVQQQDGNWEWMSSNADVLGTVYACDGKWHVNWTGRRNSGYWSLPAKFDCAHDACLAAEKEFPLKDEYFEEWFESKNGGYFWKGVGVVVYVRQFQPNGWYAVRNDGKLLGRQGAETFFATPVGACNAVQKERYTPTHPDPFAAGADDWCWVKPTSKDYRRRA